MLRFKLVSNGNYIVSTANNRTVWAPAPNNNDFAVSLGDHGFAVWLPHNDTPWRPQTSVCVVQYVCGPHHPSSRFVFDAEAWDHLSRPAQEAIEQFACADVVVVE